MIESIAKKIDCTAERLRDWVRSSERVQGQRPVLASAEQVRIKALEREYRELRQAKEGLQNILFQITPWPVARVGSPDV